jgi:hypothetical protein
MLIHCHTKRLSKSYMYNLLTGEVGGVGGVAKSYDGENDWSSIKQLIVYPVMFFKNMTFWTKLNFFF